MTNAIKTMGNPVKRKRRSLDFEARVGEIPVKGIAAS